MRRNISDLLERIKKNIDFISSLNPEEYQEIAFYLIKEKYFKNCTLKISNNWKGAVDILLEEIKRNQNGFLNPDPICHFIECKHYKDNLRLAEAGKIFCVAIRYFPKTLIIISSADLDPQVLDYAFFLFKTDTNSNYNPKFPHIFFRKIGIENLLGLPNNSNENMHENDTKGFPNIRFVKIIENHVYSRNSIFDSKIPINGQILISSDIEYLIRIHLEKVFIRESQIHDIRFRLKFLTTETTYSEASLLSINRLESGETAIEFLMPNNTTNRTYSSAELEISSKSRNIVLPVKIPEIKITNKEVLLDDLRSNENNEIISGLDKSVNKVLLFISGEGGIGKSYLCEKLCKHFCLKGSKILRQNLKDQTDAVFFLLIYPLIFPEEYSDDILKDNIVYMMLSNFFSSVFDDLQLSDLEKEKVLKKFESFRFNEIDFETYIFLITRLIISIPIHKVIWFSNCHEAHPRVINGIKLFVNRIMNAGLKNIKIIFEYRDTIEELSQYWNDFVIYCGSDYKENCLHKKVPPVREENLIKELEQHLLNIDHYRFGSNLIKKTRGNAFFIDQLIKYYYGNGYLESININQMEKFNVIDSNAVERELEDLPSELKEFLGARLQKYFRKLSGIKKAYLVQYLSIASIIGNEIIEETIRKALKLETSDITEIRFVLIKDGILKNSLDKSVFFIHDIMHLAVLAEVKNQENDFRKAVFNLLSILDNKSLKDIIISGDANYQLKNYFDAKDYFNKGREIAKANSFYWEQLLCLKKLKQIYEESLSTDDPFYLPIWAEYCYYEHQGGSQVISYRSAQALLKTIRFRIESDKQKMQVGRYLENIAFDVYHDVLTICNRLLKTDDFLTNIEECLTLKMNESVLSDILNRFVMVCSILDFPDIAWDLSNLALCLKLRSSNIFKEDVPLLEQVKLANSDDEFASLLSNFGGIYHQHNPKISNDIWKLGLSKTVSRRERMHCTLNIISGYLHSEKSFVTEDEFERVRHKVNEINVVNLKIRFNSYHSIKLWFEKKYQESRFLLLKNLESCELSSMHYMQYAIHNNLAIMALHENNFSLATKHFNSAMALIKKNCDIKMSETARIKSIQEIMKQKSLNDLGFKAVLKIAQSPPPLSSLHNTVLYNINTVLGKKNLDRCFHFNKKKEKELFVLSQETHPLICNWKGKKLILAIK